MAECLQEHIAHIVHTREGAKAGMYCVWFSSAKGRKVIIKHIKPFLDKLMTEEYGHMLLFSIFDAVDDTKLVSRSVIVIILIVDINALIVISGRLLRVCADLLDDWLLELAHTLRTPLRKLLGYLLVMSC